MHPIEGLLSPRDTLRERRYECEYSFPSILQISVVAPVSDRIEGDAYAFDFGRAAWGNLQIVFENAPTSPVLIRLGEKLNDDGTIDRDPPGSVNYREIELIPQVGQTSYQLEIPTQSFHRNEYAVKMPSEIGEVTIFRYVEMEGVNENLIQVQQLVVHAPFDDTFASFQCSDETLDAVWELCKYTMKATTAFGVYIDGERERIPYEADSYINQLSHLACDFNPTVARATLVYLLQNPTWPTEWSFHTIMMAAADFETTGESTFIAQIYEKLEAKLLMEKAGRDGLLRAGGIVDWPRGERDDYNDGEVLASDAYSQLGPELNTVVNAFYFHALRQMAFLAEVLNKEKECTNFQEMADKVLISFNKRFFDKTKGIYIDGASSDGMRSDHASLHANMFALAFDLVPPEKQSAVTDYIESRGMACSVYGAQYLLEALFRNGRDKAALKLMTSRSERSWWHMIELGSTMTLEAWDEKYKPNLTWSHAWGSAPINIVARYVFGVRPLTPGYAKTLIAPQPGTLDWAKGSVPTRFGKVEVSFQNKSDFWMEVVIPEGISAQIQWPKEEDVFVEQEGKLLPMAVDADRNLVEFLPPGIYKISPSKKGIELQKPS